MPLLPVLLVLLAVAALPASASAARLPTVHLKVAKAIPDDPKVPGRLRAGGVSTHIGIEVRGESSQSFPKKQYSVETRARDGDGRDVALFGLPASDDWVLYAPYSDKALFRNPLAYRTAARLGAYAPRTKLVELRLNGRYQGVYVLTERPKLGDGRLDDADRGYLLELTFTWQARDEEHFVARRTKRPIVFLDPDREDLSRRDLARIRRDVNRLEGALYARGRRGPGKDYGERLDVPAAVDFVLVQELLQNQDAFHGSTYFHRGADGRIVLGPVWDFDIAMGNASRGPAATLGGFITRDRPWAEQLWRHAGFRRALAARWWQLRDGGFRGRVMRDLGALRDELRDGPARRNFSRWPVLGTFVWPNPVDPRTGGYRTTWAAEAAFVRSWLQRRFAWIDRRLPRPVKTSSDAPGVGADGLG